MTMSKTTTRTAAFCVVALAAAASAMGAESVAPFVPTDQEDVETMLELAGVGPTDYLIDLGSGDGRIVITAAFRGAMGHGVELDGALVDVARDRARSGGVADVVSFEQGDIFESDLSAASVVTSN
jgi:23S rRNA G2445 N2-methylase RlmL